MSEITLRVKSIQKTMGEEPVEVDFVSGGKLYHKHGITYIMYEETELSGLEGHKTTLKLSPAKVEMHRRGPSPSKMIFEVGNRQESGYQTPYGELRIEYLTHRLSCQLNENDGEVEVEYAMVIKGLKEATHILNIKYRNHSDEPVVASEGKV